MHQMKKAGSSPVIVLLIVVIAILLGVVIFLLFSRNSSDLTDLPADSTLAESATNTPVVKNEGTISIPGFESLTFTADVLKQNVSLSNPAENTCLFRISIIDADGNILWTSGLIKPGASEQVVLKEKLYQGTYPNFKLKYERFTDDSNHTPLNRIFLTVQRLTP